MEAHIGQQKSVSSARPSVSENQPDEIVKENENFDLKDLEDRAKVHENRTNDESLISPQSQTSARVRAPLRANTQSFDNQKTPKNSRTLNEVLLGDPYKDIRRCSDSMTKSFGVSPGPSPTLVKKQSLAEGGKRDSLTRLLKNKLSDSPNLFKRTGIIRQFSRQETSKTACDDEFESSSVFYQDEFI